jgi:hypothetical protein
MEMEMETKRLKESKNHEDPEEKLGEKLVF